MLCFVPHVTNGAGPVTMSIDGAGANISLRSSPNVELPSGVLVQGSPYAVTFNQSDNALYLHGFFGNVGVPLGVGMDYWLSTPPSSQFAFPFGQAISRTTYATLFAGMGTTFGPGDGSTTFNLPDKRGRVSVALDTMGGAASGRVTAAASGVDGTTIGANGGAQNVTIARSGLPNVSPTFTGTPGTVSVSGSLTASQNNGTFNSGTAGNPATFAPNETIGFSASGTFTPQGTVQSLNGGVTQTPTIIMPPAIIVPYIIRII
jgi:microcystin-dependent protein